MGIKNWQVVRDLEIAKKDGDTQKAGKLQALLDESQTNCEHPDRYKHVTVCPEDTETTNRGLVRKGDTIVICLACSRILRHTRTTHA